MLLSRIVIMIYAYLCELWNIVEYLEVEKKPEGVTVIIITFFSFELKFGSNEIR